MVTIARHLRLQEDSKGIDTMTMFWDVHVGRLGGYHPFISETSHNLFVPFKPVYPFQYKQDARVQNLIQKCQSHHFFKSDLEGVEGTPTFRKGEMERHGRTG